MFRSSLRSLALSATLAGASLAVGFAVFLAVLCASAAHSEEAPAAPAHVLSARVGRTSNGVPRVVFETDRPVQFLTVELPQGNGYEVHLLGTDTTAVPAASAAGDDVVRSLELIPGPTGLVAHVTLAGGRRTGRAFPLENPSRVVLDLPKLGDVERGEADAAGASSAAAATSHGDATVASMSPPLTAPGAVKKAAKTSPAKSETTTPAPAPKSPAPKADSSASKSGFAAHDPLAHDSVAVPPALTAAPTSTLASAAALSTLATTPPAAAANAKASSTSEKEIADLVGWVHDVRAALDAIRKGTDGSERAHARRDLAGLLRARGLFAEAEKALLGAAESAPDDSAAATVDSLNVAELRLARGDGKGALAVASVLPPGPLAPLDRVRLAKVLLETNRADLAEALLTPVVPSLGGAAKAQASLLLARTHWDRGDAAKALPLAVDLVGATTTPPELLPRAMILEADCLCALDRSSEASALYDRASRLELTADEASWASLQLGNLARANGKLDEARERYETTKKRWPESFYAAQADWFLRFDDRLRQARDVETGKKSG